jgi:hypothetical protein
VIYTIRSARFANEENTAAVIDTVETGAKLISSRDTPAIWRQMLDSGVAIERYRAPIGFNIPKDRHSEDMGKPRVIRAK